MNGMIIESFLDYVARSSSGTSQARPQLLTPGGETPHPSRLWRKKLLRFNLPCRDEAPPQECYTKTSEGILAQKIRRVFSVLCLHLGSLCSTWQSAPLRSTHCGKREKERKKER